MASFRPFPPPPQSFPPSQAPNQNPHPPPPPPAGGGHHTQYPQQQRNYSGNSGPPPQQHPSSGYSRTGLNSGFNHFNLSIGISSSGLLVHRPASAAVKGWVAGARVETEERRARKRREYERQKQEERRQHMLKQSQANVVHKTQVASSSGVKPGMAITEKQAKRNAETKEGRNLYLKTLTTDPSKPEKFLAYMVPAPDEVRSDVSLDDPTTYLVNFDDKAARILASSHKTCSTKRRRLKEGRSGDEIEHYPVPSRKDGEEKRSCCCRRPSGISRMPSYHEKVDKRGRSSREDDLERPVKLHESEQS
ncbi:hypothetical protein J5N97_025249 [Dioscorea zingiberensis]|uniref:Uncharacterized protein n=1 Tax=Dioscorea zingiberensis TaxID=325984 RepID=A0A9D5C7Y4_9LILI|nr:hypothetical protein J5N97_025249 [Dioscorea zingiberensis]